MAEQPTQQKTIDDVLGEIKEIKCELKKASKRDMQAAWLTFAAVGAGFIGAGVVSNWPAAIVGIIMVALGYFGARFSWFTRRG